MTRETRSVQIGERIIGAGYPCFLVAEIGINHNGDMKLAKQMIDAAVHAGANAVKFQNYRTDDFISDRSLTHRYISQGKTVVESQYDLFKRCELSREALGNLKRYSDDRGVLFHSTPTSKEGIRDLIEIGVQVLKNGSDYLTHLPLIREMGSSGLPSVLSTGMATEEEIDDAVEAFRDTGNNQLILLQCTSCYPTDPADTHLRKIPALEVKYGCVVGFSDHTEGIEAAVGAVALGACWIEKHFTLDKQLPGPDQRFSADPLEFEALAKAVRRMEESLGDPRLGPSESERQGRLYYRLSCVAARPLPAGHELIQDDLAFRRPGTGLPPGLAGFLIGHRLRHDIGAGDVIGWGDLQ